MVEMDFAAGKFIGWAMISLDRFLCFWGFSKKCNFCGTRVKYLNFKLLPSIVWVNCHVRFVQHNTIVAKNQKP